MSIYDALGMEDIKLVKTDMFTMLSPISFKKAMPTRKSRTIQGSGVYRNYSPASDEFIKDMHEGPRTVGSSVSEIAAQRAYDSSRYPILIHSKEPHSPDDCLECQRNQRLEEYKRKAIPLPSKRRQLRYEKIKTPTPNNKPKRILPKPTISPPSPVQIFNLSPDPPDVYSPSTPKFTSVGSLEINQEQRKKTILEDILEACGVPPEEYKHFEEECNVEVTAESSTVPSFSVPVEFPPPKPSRFYPREHYLYPESYVVAVYSPQDGSFSRGYDFTALDMAYVRATSVVKNSIDGYHVELYSIISGLPNGGFEHVLLQQWKRPNGYIPPFYKPDNLITQSCDVSISKDNRPLFPEYEMEQSFLRNKISEMQGVLSSVVSALSHAQNLCFGGELYRSS